MQKLNNLPQTLILGVVATAALTITPAQAQTLDGAETVLRNCPSTLRFPQKCDPNAQVVLPTSETGVPAGLQGSVNFVPLGDPGGFILTGSGGTDRNGNPLFDIDFEPPEGQGFGNMFTVNAGIDSDFRAYLGWEGTIQDLTRTLGGNGVPFPAPGGRIRDFIRVDRNVGSGNGIVNGYQTGGFAADLVFVNDVEINSIVPGVTSEVSFDWEMQVYKLTPSGERIEEQTPLPPVTEGLVTTFQTTVFANQFEGGLSATFPFSDTELRSLLSSGEPLDGFGYDITLESTPGSRPIVVSDDEVVPEPTTILSSLLLFGGGAFKLKNRKQS